MRPRNGLRQTFNRGGRSMTVVVVLGALALAGPAVAAKEPVKEGAKERISIVSDYWAITVNGHRYEVKAGGEIIYPACDTVESIAAVVKFKLNAKHEPVYRADLRGPKTAGLSDGLEGTLTPPTAVIERPFEAAQFTKLAANTNAPHIPPGKYTLRLSFAKTGELIGDSAKPKAVEKIKLIARAQC